MSIDLTKHSTASERGWGSGWPDCQPDTIVPLQVGKVSFLHGIRAEIHDLVVMLLEEVQGRGYELRSPGCYGYDCRAIKKPGGGFTDDPSNHSWGLAIDINAPANPNTKGPLVTDMPEWMPDLFNEYGFRWGGDYRTYGGSSVDAMHMEFYGTEADGRAMTEEAQEKGLGTVLTDDQKQTLADAKAFLDELRDTMGSLDDREKPAIAKFAGARVARSVLKAESASGKGEKGDKDENVEK